MPMQKEASRPCSRRGMGGDHSWATVVGPWIRRAAGVGIPWSVVYRSLLLRRDNQPGPVSDGPMAMLSRGRRTDGPNEPV